MRQLLALVCCGLLGAAALWSTWPDRNTECAGIGADRSGSITDARSGDVGVAAAPGATANAPRPSDLPRLPVSGPAPPQVSSPDSGLPGLIAPMPQAQLSMPLAGVDPAQLSDQFGDPRGEGRGHEAIDLQAPLGTPVLAVDAGRVVKLFTSVRGGLTVYQFDSRGELAYYYAHLNAYAEGLAEGQVLERGDVIGYVGFSGNADPATPHLHFAVFELGPEKRWWKGKAINPYPLLGGQAKQ